MKSRKSWALGKIEYSDEEGERMDIYGVPEEYLEKQEVFGRKARVDREGEKIYVWSSDDEGKLVEDEKEESNRKKMAREAREKFRWKEEKKKEEELELYEI